MRVFYKGKDGGLESTVWGYWLCEFKRLFSIVLLKFENGTRDAYHTHAFNCISWVLSGKLEENNFDGNINIYKPSLIPIVTKRSTFHKVVSTGNTWVISFRGPWLKTWEEYLPIDNKKVVLSDGRKEV